MTFFKKPQYTIYTILVIVSIIALLLVIFSIYPLLKDALGGPRKIFLEKNRVTLISAEIKELENFKKNYKEYQPNLAKIDQLFIDEKNPIDFIKFLEDISRNTHISSSMSFIPRTNKEIIDNLPVATFQILARGNFLDLFYFIEKLETGPYLIRVQSANIKKVIKDINGTKTTYGVEMNLLIKAAIRPPD